MFSGGGRDTGSCCGLETEIRRTILGKFRFVDRTKGKREQKAADRSRDSQKRGKRLLVGRGKQGGGGVRRRVGNADSQRTRAQTSSSMGDSGRGSVEALPRRCPFSAEKGDVADEQGWLPPFSHHLSSRTLTPVQRLLQGKLRYAQPPAPQSLTAEPSLSLSLLCVQSCLFSLCLQRIGPKGNDAVLERTVVYDYSENIPLFLKTFVGNGERYVMRQDKLDHWQDRIAFPR